MLPVTRRPSLSPHAWDALFDFLDPARPEKNGPHRNEKAEDKFQEIMRKLVYFFAARGCSSDAEDLAMETMVRVAGRATELANAAFADRTAYFYGVAHNVHHERVREARRDAALQETAAVDPALRGALRPQPDSAVDRRHRCLDQCMVGLTAGARRLILSYYEGDTASVASHRRLATQLGKSVNALRIEVHRIRNTLRRCVTTCVARQIDGTTS